MAKTKSRPEMRHVRLHQWLLDSAAYRSLGLPARALLVELYSLYNGTNNGELFLSVRKAAERLGFDKDAAKQPRGCAPSSARRAFKELIDRRLIKAHTQGGFTWKERHAAQWILTEFHHPSLPKLRPFMDWRKPTLLTEGCISDGSDESCNEKITEPPETQAASPVNRAASPVNQPSPICSTSEADSIVSDPNLIHQRHTDSNQGGGLDLERGNQTEN